MKTKKLLSIFLSMAILFSLFVVPVSADTVAPTEKWSDNVAAAFNDGNGTVDSPYEIATAEQLAKLAVDVNSGVYGQTYSAAYFILTADIDLGGKLWTPIGTGTTEGSYHSFDGYFDGNNKTISNMYVDERASGSSAGLFGNMYARGSDNTDVDVDYVVKNLTIESATVITAGGEYTYAGILAGYASVTYPVNDIKIINCHVSGTVTTTGRAGGLIGSANYIAADNCSADAVVTGNGFTGGFVGDLFYPAVSGCTAKGTVNGTWSAGGFAGVITNQLNADTAGVKNCFSYVDVTASNWNVGGFAGYVGGTDIEKCAAYGDVTSTVTGWLPKLGGFAGSLEPCIGYREGDSSETYYASLTDCYYAGKLTSAHPTEKPSGLAAVVTNSIITDCAYDGEKNSGIVGYADEETSTALSTAETGSEICLNILGEHTMEDDNTCTVCGYTEYSITLGGVQVTNVNADDVLGDGGSVKYDPDTNTLTLTDATINNTDGVGIEAKDSGITIVGVDTDADGANTIGGSTSAIKVDGDITIKGKIVDIIGGSDGGVYSTNGNINIDIDAVLGDISSDWYTLQTDEGNIVIDGTVGNINGLIAITSEYSHDVIINGKVGDITGVDYGIFSYKDYKVAENAEVGNIASNGFGIMAVANIEINGKVGDVSGQYAIRSLTGKVTINSVIGTVKGECDDETATVAAIVGNAGIELADNIVIKTPTNAEIKGGTNYIVYDTKGTEETEDDTFADIVELAYLYTVTFETGDGSVVEGQPVVDGDVATEPDAPTRSGYKFDGWYTDTDYTTKYDFDTPVSEDITIYAKWTKKSSGGGGVTRYTITFNSNGGTTVSNKTVTRNSKLTEPTAPTKDGYTFDGWYTDKELTKAYDFDTKVTKAITLYAKWTENKVDNTDDKTDETDDKTDTPDTTVWENPFTDVETDDWYYENVEYAVENGLMGGTTDTTFAPNGIITRAMMVTVLYRAEGEPEITGTTTFEDVDSSAYYAKAVVWGQQNGIIKGYSETEFAPDQNIIREQIAAIMHRYAQYKGYDVSAGENTNILSYDDFDSISDYAVISMQYAVGSGLMKGKTESTLNPLDNAARAEIAAILHRFIEANK